MSFEELQLLSIFAVLLNELNVLVLSLDQYRCATSGKDYSTLFRKLKKGALILIFGKKCPDCFHLRVKYLI